MITKKDYFLVSIVGILFGLLCLPVLKNIKIISGAITLNKAFWIVFSLAIFANIALYLASIISRWIPIVLEVAKFAAIGGLNTLLDLGILNVLMISTGVVEGYSYSAFKGFSFIIASINSYFWNKFWTFNSQNSASVKEYTQFLTVSVVGFIMNIGVASLVVNVFGAPAEVSPELWANIGAVSATIISLVWNFIGYKLIVFKKNEEAN